MELKTGKVVGHLHWKEFPLEELGFFILLAVLPFSLILAPTALGLTIVLLGVSWNRSSRNIRFKYKRGIFLIPIYFMSIVLWSLSIEDNENYISSWDTQIPLLIIPILMGLMRVDPKFWLRAKQVFVIACLLFCLLSFATLFNNYIINYEHRLNYNFYQRSMYHFHFPYDVLYINTSMIMLLFGTWKKMVKWMVGIIFFLFILISGVRMGLFSLGIILITYAAGNYRSLLQWKVLLALFTIGAISFYVLFSSPYTRDKIFDTFSQLGFKTEAYVSEIGSEYHKLTLREKIWDASIELIQRRPFGGYGPDKSLEQLERQYERLGYVGMAGINSHNQFLTSTLEMGILGGVLLLLIFGYALIITWRNGNYSAFLWVLITFLACLTESLLVRQKGVFYFSIFITWAILEGSSKRIDKPSTSPVAS